MRPVKNILWGYNIGAQNQPGRYNSETLYIVSLILEICAEYAAVFQSSHASGRRRAAHNARVPEDSQVMIEGQKKPVPKQLLSHRPACADQLSPR